MRVEKGKIDGDTRISDDVVLQGMITGNTVVENGGKLILSGMICQNLILEKGSMVELHGMVCRNVFNRGGNLRVYGMILESLRTESGTTFIDPKAVIKGKTE